MNYLISFSILNFVILDFDLRFDFLILLFGFGFQFSNSILVSEISFQN